MDVRVDGGIAVGEHNKQSMSDTLQVTGSEVPDDVAEIMAIVDLLPIEEELPGGSHKVHHQLSSVLATYFIGNKDLQTKGETS